MPTSNPITESSAPLPARAAVHVQWLLREKGWMLAVGVVIFGLILRIDPKLGYWTNPDEGINYSIISHPTLAECWNELVSNTHPPLISIVLWLMSTVSYDPTWFRSASVFFGCTAIFGTYLAGRALSDASKKASGTSSGTSSGTGSATSSATGLLAALLVAISPAAIEQSQIIRPYMLQLALLTFGIYYFGRFLQRDADRGAEGRVQNGRVGFSICMALALAAQYSSLFVVAACALILLASRVRQTLLVARPPLREVIADAVPFVAPAVVALTLYLVQVKPLMESALRADAKATWLAPFLMRDLGDTWLHLLGTQAQFFSRDFCGPALLILLGSLLICLATRSLVGFLMLILFTAAVLASVAGHYPLGSSRHSMYLLPFVALTIGRGVSTVAARGWIATAVFTASLTTLLVFATPISETTGRARLPSPFPQEAVMRWEEWEKFSALLAELREREEIIICNLQTYYTLYPELRQHWEGHARHTDFGMQFQWGRSQFLVNADWNMTLTGNRFGEAAHLHTFIENLDRDHKEIRLRGRSTVWVIFSGWYAMAADELTIAHQRFSGQRQLIRRHVRVEGALACEVDLPFFMDLFAEIRLQAEQRAKNK